jgi:hypothetical protein
MAFQFRIKLFELLDMFISYPTHDNQKMEQNP